MKKRQKRLVAALGALAAVLAFSFAPPPAAAASSCVFMFCANGCYCGGCTDDCERDCYDGDYCSVLTTGCNTDE